MFTNTYYFKIKIFAEMYSLLGKMYCFKKIIVELFLSNISVPSHIPETVYYLQLRTYADFYFHITLLFKINLHK